MTINGPTLRDCTRANVEAVATNGVAHLGEIVIVRIGAANEVEGVGAPTEGEAHRLCAFQIADNTDGGRPMLQCVAI